MAKLKTQANDADVDAFIESITDEEQREDARRLVALLSKITKQSARMWGSAIIGFGSFRYTYASGREGDWLTIGFSPRKGKTTIYCMDGFESHQTDLEKLGKHTTAKSCLYITHLGNVDMKVLERILTRSYANTQAGKLFTPK